MKREVGGKLFLGFLLLIFLSSGVLAFTTCKIVPENQCNNSGERVIMRVSSTTNAHGESRIMNVYDYEVCCGNLTDVNGAGNITCKIDGSNEVIGLSALTNAHAEFPGGSSYAISSGAVCFENIICEKIDNSCPTTGTIPYMGILSISSNTNAHIGPYDGTGSYSTKICCHGGVITSSSCTIKSATWSVANAIEDQGVRLVVTGSGSECNGRVVTFEVLESDVGSTNEVVTEPVNVAFNGATATGLWYAEWQDDGVLGGNPEYIFNVSFLQNKKISKISSDPKLTISQDAEFCSTITTCDDYNVQAECESDASLCAVAEASSLPDVNCDSESTLCGCIWSSTTNTCQFGWGEIEECGDPADGCNYGCTLCHNSTGNYCGLGSTCPSGENPISNNNESCDPGEGCSSSDCDDGDVDTCGESLYCLSDKCSSVESPLELGLLGNCQITQTIEKGCEEEPVGYKIISWTGIWTGEQTGTTYQKCITGGKTTIPCAAQVQLPFFTNYELIITLGIIALIYIILIYKHKGKKKSKK